MEEPLNIAPRAEAGEWVERAASLLQGRHLAAASEALGTARSLGADADGCSGLEWQIAMLQGDFAAAWVVNDALRRRGGPDPHRLWLGEEVAGAKVVVRCLHGLGDAVQMLRFAPMLGARVGSLVFEVPPRFFPLAPYFRGVERVITWGKEAPAVPPTWEVQVEIMEVPYLLRVTAGELPVATRYLELPATLGKETGSRMGARAWPRVGVVWTGGEWNLRRSIPRALLEAALGGVEVEFWSLQGRVDEGPRRWPERDVLAECGDGLLALASTIAHLDLVITIDTLAAHLAGALGAPVWLMLEHAADWRWMDQLGESPWYPSMRIFRQRQAGDWEGVAGAVRSALEERRW